MARDPDKDLWNLRAKWEKDLSLVYMSDRIESTGCVLTISKNAEGLYFLHRYFTIGGKWHVSVDGSNVAVEQTWGWLDDPRALAKTATAGKKKSR